MIGQGVMRECLAAPDVHRVVAVGRSASDQRDAKLEHLVLPNLADLSGHRSALSGFDACLFSLGVSAVGLSEAEYSKVTYDLTLSVARTLLDLNPDMTFVYVSGQGTDSTERGRLMWARVKGRTENALLKLSPRTYMVRPGAIIPLHGIRSRTGWYNAAYAVATPLYPVLRRLFPGSITTTEQLGRAMLHVARHGFAHRILETPDINAASRL
jgi:uncharacterized protein YbjT (DUF2867 family)